MTSEIKAWVASIPGVGPKRFRALSQRFPDVSTLLSVSKTALIHKGVPVKLADVLVRHRETHPPESIHAFCRANDVRIVTQSDPLYPPLLLQISDPPVVLYVKGTLPDWSTPTIAVVGTRQITSYGRLVTQELTAQLVQAGCTIISGFMYGVDAVAHETVIEKKGKTVGVLGYGFGAPFYPRSHALLAETIYAAGSCLVTEFPPWQHATAANFPLRNRIVSGMSLGVVVTEAASKSGSKITAECAVNQGRDVFAVPGPIHSTFSEGTKELVNLGAKLVTTAVDILEELPMRISTGIRIEKT